MQIKFFAIPALHPESAEAELSRFFASRRILAIDRELVQDRANSFWAVCVTYIEAESRELPARRQPKIDYREVLAPPEFELYSRLRELRKRIASHESLPPYAVFTDAHGWLARELSRRPPPRGMSMTITPPNLCDRDTVERGPKRVIRGGSWNSNARNVRAAYRNANEPGNRNDNLGFRLLAAQTWARWPAPDPTAVPSQVARDLGKSTGGRRASRTKPNARRHPPFLAAHEGKA